MSNVINSPVRITDMQQAISLMHQHTNKAVLDRLTVVNNELLLDGQPIGGTDIVIQDIATAPPIVNGQIVFDVRPNNEKIMIDRNGVRVTVADLGGAASGVTMTQVNDAISTHNANDTAHNNRFTGIKDDISDIKDKLDALDGVTWGEF